MPPTSGSPWSITAHNLPEHARNPIHTDAGARAAGFDRALVAGVTTYAYCCHPAIEAFGLGWLERGQAEVRFRSPVFDGDHLTLPAIERSDGGIDIGVVVARVDRPLAEMSAWPSHHDVPSVAADSASRLAEPEPLRPVTIRLEGEYGSEYGERAGDTSLDLAGHVHPGVWPALANYVFHRQLARGSWVHTRSVVRHHAMVRDGEEATVSSRVIDRFHRGGDRALAEVEIRVRGQLVATLEHEAIVDVTAAAPD